MPLVVGGALGRRMGERHPCRTYVDPPYTGERAAQRGGGGRHPTRPGTQPGDDPGPPQPCLRVGEGQSTSGVSLSGRGETDPALIRGSPLRALSPRVPGDLGGPRLAPPAGSPGPGAILPGNRLGSTMTSPSGRTTGATARTLKGDMTGGEPLSWPGSGWGSRKGTTTRTSAVPSPEGRAISSA